MELGGDRERAAFEVEALASSIAHTLRGMNDSAVYELTVDTCLITVGLDTLIVSSSVATLVQPLTKRYSLLR